MARSEAGKPQHIYNELYGVLLDAFPEHRSAQNVFDVPRFAKDIGRSHETVYKALRADRLHLGVAEAILELSHEDYPDGALFWEDMIRFCLPAFTRFRRPSDSLDAPLGDFDLDALLS